MTEAFCRKCGWSFKANGDETECPSCLGVPVALSGNELVRRKPTTVRFPDEEAGESDDEDHSCIY